MEITKTRKNHLRMKITYEDELFIYSEWVSDKKFIIKRWIIKEAIKNKILSIDSTDRRNNYNVRKNLIKVLENKNDNPDFNFALKPFFRNTVFSWKQLPERHYECKFIPKVNDNTILNWKIMHSKRKTLVVTSCLYQEPDLDNPSQEYRPLRILQSSILQKTYLQEKYFQLFYYLFKKLTRKNVSFLQQEKDPNAMIEVFHGSYGTIGFVMPIRREIIEK